MLPSVLLAALLLLYLLRDDWMVFLVTGFPDEIRGLFLLNRVLVLAIWITGTWAFLAAVSSIGIRWFEARRGQKVPVLLTTLFRFAVILLVSVSVLVSVFNMTPLTVGLLFAGSVVLGVLFLRDIFSELMAGLSLSMDKQFGIGSRIELAGDVGGVVEEMNWRSVLLRQVDGSGVVVPNSHLSGEVVRSLTDLGDRRDLHFYVTLDFSLPVERGSRVLTAAVVSAAQEQGIISNPPPRAYASGPGSFGIDYRIDFSYHANEIDEGAARSAVVRQIMSHLKETGLSIALPKQNVFVGEARMMSKNWEVTLDRQALISKIELFRSLESEEIRRLADEAVIHNVPGGEEIIQEGEQSTSMFGVAEGLLEVTVNNNDTDLVVAVISPGDCFGEMSMLADEPRSATVKALVDSLVFEIRRESFREILQSRAEVAESISRLIAERQLSNNEKLQLASEQERIEALTDASSNLLDRIRVVFSLFTRQSNGD